jgi:cytochrome c-type biogenesis protein CcmF
VINNVLLFIALLIVLLGTLYPMIVNVLGWQTISVGAPYFNTVLLPLFILVLFFILFTFRIKNVGMLCAHVGIIVTAVGIFLSAGFDHARQLSLHVGERAHLDGYTFVLQHMYELNGPNYGGASASVLVEKNQQMIAQLHPELKLFHHPLSVLPKSAISPGVFRDLYVALGVPLPNNNWTVEIAVKPFVRWVWAGGFLMMLGGLIAFVLRKRNIYEKKC